MKFVFLHGLGQTAQDWQAVIHQSSLFDVDCPELFSFAENAFTYSGILSGRYAIPTSFPRVQHPRNRRMPSRKN